MSDMKDVIKSIEDKLEDKPNTIIKNKRNKSITKTATIKVDIVDPEKSISKRITR